MDPLDRIAEQRIREALAQGQLSGLEGEGAPLALDDDRLVPEELRAAYRILKNAGMLPPELELLKEIREVEELLLAIEDRAARPRALARLAMLRSRLAAAGRSGTALIVEDAYYRKLAARLDRD